MLADTDTIGTVVVAEDHEPTLALLCENLLADRFDPLPAASVADALRRCRYDSPDAMILDLGLPDGSGLDVMREIRAAGGPAPDYDADLPIVVLSGSGSDWDRVRGLREGADDYLVKPFHYPELVVRVEHLLERRSEGRRAPIVVGPLCVDSVRREVRVDERRVRLANKEFELLRALASDPERVFTKAELLERVWGYRAQGRTRTLDSHASRLRRKLDPEGGRYVKNCWGVGYRLVEA